MTERPMAALLIGAAEWFNTALLAHLEAQGWPHLSRNQSQVFPLLAVDGGTSPSAIARQLGITRQSAHVLLGQLVDLGILAQEPDPQDGRRTLVGLTDRGRSLAADAGRILVTLEEQLADRIGTDAVAHLHDALARDWGDPLLP